MRSWIDGSRAKLVSERGRGGLRPLRRFGNVHGVAGLALFCAVGCGGARAGSERSSAPSAGKVITAEAIAASGAKTAWDALRLTVPNLQLRESDGRPTRIQRRGRASIYLDDQVRLMVDPVRVDGIDWPSVPALSGGSNQATHIAQTVPCAEEPERALVEHHVHPAVQCSRVGQVPEGRSPREARLDRWI